MFKANGHTKQNYEINWYSTTFFISFSDVPSYFPTPDTYT